MDIVMFIVGVLMFSWATKQLIDIKSTSRHSIKVKGKVKDGVIEVKYDGKTTFKKIAMSNAKGDMEVYINPNNGRIFTEFEIEHYNKYRRNTILLYLLDLIFLLPPLLTWCGINDKLAWFGTVIFVIFMFTILIATKTLIMTTDDIGNDLLNEKDFEKKVITKLGREMFDENFKDAQIIPLSYEKHQKKYKLAKAFIIAFSIIAFAMTALMLMIESINVFLAILILGIFIAIIFLVAPKDEGFKQDIIIKKDSLIWFITHTENESRGIYEWYDMYKIKSIRKYDTDDTTFIIKGDIEKKTKRPGFRSKYINASLDEIKIPRVFDEEEFIFKKLDELVKE